MTEAVSFSVPGYFGRSDSARVLPGLEAGSHPWFQVRAWRFAPGIWPADGSIPILEIGASDIFRLDLAGPGLGETVDEAPVLHGMTPFQLRLAVSLTVGVEAGQAVIAWVAEDRRLPLYLERATSIGGSWQVLSNAVSPHVEPVNVESPVFFRIAARSSWLQANKTVEATQPRLDSSHDQ